MVAATPICLGNAAYGQTPQAPLPGFRIQQVMTPDAFQKSGLSKLSPAELASLNSWLSAAIPIIVSRLQTAPPTSPGSIVESRIDGEFHGWDGDTVYKLMNGQIWQQARYHYHYHYAYSPKVLIYPSAGGYAMRVDGDDDESISVLRLR